MDRIRESEAVEPGEIRPAAEKVSSLIHDILVRSFVFFPLPLFLCFAAAPFPCATGPRPAGFVYTIVA